ncbi:MAG TPA: CoA-disulfide reductase [Anaerolineae bacterium]|nr:CoA-disulfide reductase [Anaerolineae bacterium]
MKLVVIGGVAAGMSAAARAKRRNKDLQITVYEKSGYVSYGACGLPYFIKGDIPRAEQLIVRTPEQFAKQGIKALVHHEVIDVDPKGHTVTVKNLETGETFQDRWDELLITTGAVAVKPPIPGLDLPGIFTLRTVEDGIAIREWIEKKHPWQAVVVGAGYIGLEMAEALAANGMYVDVVEMLPQVLPNMDEDMAALVQEELARHGVTLHLNSQVREFKGDGRVQQVIAGDKILNADIVIFSVGARANIPLAEKAGVAIGETGAIAVDDHQRTNAPHIWAAGDVAEAWHRVLNKPAYIPLGTTANKQGRIAGTNIAGGDEAFAGIVGTAVVKVFDLEVARTGLSEREAKDAGFDAASVTIKAPARAHYMPIHPPIHVKLVFEKGAKKLLGGQMVGEEGVAKRIDVIAAALYDGWTLYDLKNLDLSYAPPFAPVWDPILVAANVASK